MSLTKTLLASALCVGVFSGTAQAKPEDNSPLFSKVNQLAFLDSTQAKPKETKPPQKNKKVKVKSGDTLHKIARKYKTSVDRLWRKNRNIKNPDQLKVGMRLVLPAEGEKLKKRPYPQVQVQTPFVGARTSSGAGKLIAGRLGVATPCQPSGHACNCVAYPGLNNPFDGTNPDGWAVLTSTPSIGATALFNFQHVGMVVGIWSNGDVEIDHWNYGGGQTRFSPSEMRGYR